MENHSSVFIKVISKASEVFGKREKPEIITSQSEKYDSIRVAIQNEFGTVKVDSMSSHECKQIILEHSLINDSAYLYFLPRILFGVFEEENWYEDFVYRRLTLVKQGEFRKKELKLLPEILDSLNKLSLYHDSLE